MTEKVLQENGTLRVAEQNGALRVAEQNGALRVAVIVDARGLKCPLPVLKTEKALAGLKFGAALTVLATDPMAKVDIPLLCRQAGHLCKLTAEGEVLRFAIVKAG